MVHSAVPETPKAALPIAAAAFARVNVRRPLRARESQKDLVVGIWNDCACLLKVPADRLRPTDRFDRELSAYDFSASLDDPKDDLFRYIRSREKHFGTAISLEDVTNVGELVLRLAKLERDAAPETFKRS